MMRKVKGSIWRAAGRGLTAGIILGAGATLGQAQDATETTGQNDIKANSAPVVASTAAQAVSAAPKLDEQVLSSAATETQPFSSSSAEAPASMEEMASLGTEHFNFGSAMQYGGRRRYGKPRYRGGNTNADGSTKYDFFAGGGFTVPVGSDSNYLKTSYGFQVGGGRNFNQHVGLNAQFDWDAFGFTGQTLENYSQVYLGVPQNTYGLDGHSHIWSLTLDPTYNIRSGDTLGAYVVVGGGFYHKAANFFVPIEAQGYDYYYGPYVYIANETLQNYTSNSAGVNGGVGITYKFSKFANQRLYGEVRVVHTFNSYRPGVTVNTPTSVANAYTGSNFFPQNSQSTTYLPVKVGIRF